MAKKETSPDLDRLLTIKQTAQILNCSEKSVRRKIADGRIEAMKDGNMVRVRPGSVSHYIHNHLVG